MGAVEIGVKTLHYPTRHIMKGEASVMKSGVAILEVNTELSSPEDGICNGQKQAAGLLIARFAPCTPPLSVIVKTF